jgi:hypothetical protein
MKIAKIVKSNSHIDYVGRVIDKLDSANPPAKDDYGFAQFVKLPLADGREIVGVIYNSILLNPEYANSGPRLSSAADLAAFSPDFLSEQGELIGILLLGTRENGRSVQGVPRIVVPAGQDVFRMEHDDAKAFHTDPDGSLQIHYYSQIVAHAGLFATQLLEAIVDQLGSDADDETKKRLGVLKQALAWQRTVGGMRL